MAASDQHQHTDQGKPRRRISGRGGGGRGRGASSGRKNHGGRGRGRSGRGGDERGPPGADAEEGDAADGGIRKASSNRRRHRPGRRNDEDAAEQTNRREKQPAGNDKSGNGRSGGRGLPSSAEGGTRNAARADAKFGRNGNDNKSNRRPNKTNGGRSRNQSSDVVEKEQKQRQRPRNKQDNNGNGGGGKHNRSRTKKVRYEPHATLPSCLERYASGDPSIVRGKLRVMPARNGAAFVTCDRGSVSRDVVIRDEKDRNRALDGDFVFVELFPLSDGGEDGSTDGPARKAEGNEVTIADFMTNLDLDEGAEGSGREDGASKRSTEEEEEEAGDIVYEEEEYLIDDEFNDPKGEKVESDEGFAGDDDDDEEEAEMWHDDEAQMSLWDPKVNLRKKSKRPVAAERSRDESTGPQRGGRVVLVLPPKSGAGKQPSEIAPQDESRGREEIHKRTIVGTLARLPDGGAGGGGRCLLVPNNKSLPRFMCPAGTRPDEPGDDDADDGDDGGGNSRTLYRAEYAHGSWRPADRWPPCSSVRRLCDSNNVEGETKALLVENGVDHGEFPPAVLRDVEESVKSGRFLDERDGVEDMGWRPTKEMYKGRRDYRKQRVFTIDPTTARDLDDALHITPLPDGRVEIGVHIADVSHFISPGSAVDEEALRRATTVYLVNGIVPMLPRPLCEIACSLNEDVERLAFSCVWRMNRDGTLGKKKGGREKPGKDDIWYGRTVIKSCARLDYATAQNIIDGKVANGERRVDEAFWPESRQPTGGHTIDEVAGDVRLMHEVAMARRRLRFDNGALALNGVKLAFQLEEDGETPKLCAPYPIRDSNRLIEEFMLLANYLVAQRLITHARGRALLRNHMPPIEQGMQQVVDVSKESFDFDIDTTDSRTLQESLSRLSRECDDELVVQCVTESLTTPMRPAEYLAAGELDEADWAHFALNIPYYTHFTSPIRRYPDVIVHRLLSATLDEEVDEFSLTQKEIHSAAAHCNDMRMSAKKAQERSDRVFLSLYLKKNPISSTLGVCLGVGEKTFTVFVPSLGLSTRVFLQEHEEEFVVSAFEDEGGRRRIVIRPRTNDVPGMEQYGGGGGGGRSWKSLDVRVFAKLEVACTCKTRPPIDVRVKVVGPWRGATSD